MTETIPFIGWREWLALPELGIPAIKAKIDTGARTSCLHTFDCEEIQKEGVPWVRFRLHPLQKESDQEVVCEAKILEYRYVTDSGGHRELRPVINTAVMLAGCQWHIEVTLSNRESMLFRMLLGRTAMVGKLRVDPSLSFVCGEPLPETLNQYYPKV